MLNEEQERFKKLIEERAKWVEEKDPHLRSDLLPSKRFSRTGNDNRLVIKTGLLKSETTREGKKLGQTWIYPNYAAIAKMIPSERNQKTWGRLRTSVDFNQRRAGTLIKTFGSEKSLRRFQNDLENIFICIMAYDGFKNLALRRDGDGELVFVDKQSDKGYVTLSQSFHQAVVLETYSRFQGDDRVPFGEMTRTILPDFMRRIQLDYRIDSYNNHSTVFDMPSLDVGKMAFRIREDDLLLRIPSITEYVRLKGQSRDVSSANSEVITADYMDHKILRFLNDAMAEMGTHDRQFIDDFLGNINKMRETRRALPAFSVHKLSSAHMDIIPRLQ